MCFWQKHTQKPKKLFISAPEHPRTVLNAFLECMYLANLIWTDVAYMDVANETRNLRSLTGISVSFRNYRVISGISGNSGNFVLISIKHFR